MLEKIFHLLWGYGEFQVLGDAPRFFNGAAKQGIVLWGFSKKGDVASARVRAGDYKRLLPLCRRCGVRLRLASKRGLPFQTARLWRRKGLVFGVMLGACLYGYLSGFVWGVTVSGAQVLTDREILTAAAEYGVYVGGPQREMDPRRATYGILTQVEGLSWASVNTDGCFLEVAVRESEETPAISDDKAWSNIVASREGKILAIQAQRGRPEVRLGDTVKKGQLLISGLYQEVPDPYGPQPDRLLETAGAARGTVTAETYREFAVQVSSRKTQEAPAGKEQRRGSLEILGLRVPLSLGPKLQKSNRSYTQVHTLRVLGVDLPVVYREEVFQPLEERVWELSREQQQQEALRKLREAQRTALGPGAKILSEEISYSFGEGVCVAAAKSRCQEEIGQLQEILAE